MSGNVAELPLQISIFCDVFEAVMTNKFVVIVLSHPAAFDILVM